MVDLKPADYDPLTYGGDATIMRTPWLWRFSGSDLISLASGLGILVCFFLPWVSFYELGQKVSYSGLQFVNQVDQARMGEILLIPSIGAILAVRGFSYAMLRTKGVLAWPHAAVSMLLGAMAVGFWYWAGSAMARYLLVNHGVHMLFNAEIGYYATMFFAGLALAAAIGEAIEHMIWKGAVKKGVNERASKFGMIVMPETVLPPGVAKALGIAQTSFAASAGAGAFGGPAEAAGAVAQGAFGGGYGGGFGGAAMPYPTVKKRGLKSGLGIGGILFLLIGVGVAAGGFYLIGNATMTVDDPILGSQTAKLGQFRVWCDEAASFGLELDYCAKVRSAQSTYLGMGIGGIVILVLGIVLLALAFRQPKSRLPVGGPAWGAPGPADWRQGGYDQQSQAGWDQQGGYQQGGYQQGGYQPQGDWQQTGATGKPPPRF
jgi:hypothetical protein